MTLEKFYRICDNIEPDEYGCHHYPGEARNYRKITIERKLDQSIYRKAHQLVLERKLGRPIHSGLCALHHCDLKSCVNPEHLYEGTTAENNRDARNRNPRTYYDGYRDGYEEGYRKGLEVAK